MLSSVVETVVKAVAPTKKSKTVVDVKDTDNQDMEKYIDNNKKYDHGIDANTLKHNIELINQLAGKCDSYHSVCKDAHKTLTKLIKENKIISNDVIDAFILFLVKTHDNQRNYYYKAIDCWTNFETYKNTIATLIALHCPSEYVIEALIDKSNYDILDLICKLDYILKENVLELALNKEKPYNKQASQTIVGNNTNEYVCDLLSQYERIPVTLDNLNRAIEQGYEKTIMNILSRKVEPNRDSLILAIESKECTLEIISTIVSMGVAPNASHLELACETSADEKIITFFLELKIEPNETCFKNVLNRPSAGQNYYGYRRRNNKYHQAKEIKDGDQKTKIIDLLIAYGYIPTYEDVLSAVKKYVKINDIERFDITLDEKYLIASTEANFTPYKTTGIKHTVAMLEKACARSGNLAGVKQIVKTGVVPNGKCLEEKLEEACRFKNNLQTIKYLIDNKAPVTVEALAVMCNTIGNRTLIYLFDKHRGLSDAEIKKKQDVLNGYGSESGGEEDAYEEHAAKEEHKSLITDMNDLYFATEEAKKRSLLEELDDTISNSEESEDSAGSANEDGLELIDTEIDEPVRGPRGGLPRIKKEPKPTIIKKKEPKLVGGKSKKVLVKGKKSSPVAEAETKSTEVKPVIETATPKYKTITVIENERELKARESIVYGDRLRKVMPAYYKPLDKKVTYAKLKQLLMEYMNKNKLFDQDNKMMVKINKELSELTKYEENSYLNFVDFDSFVKNIFIENP